VYYITYSKPTSPAKVPSRSFGRGTKGRALDISPLPSSEDAAKGDRRLFTWETLRGENALVALNVDRRNVVTFISNK
jgi:hypothetical protein